MYEYRIQRLISNRREIGNKKYDTNYCFNNGDIIFDSYSDIDIRSLFISRRITISLKNLGSYYIANYTTPYGALVTYFANFSDSTIKLYTKGFEDREVMVSLKRRICWKNK